MNVHGDAATVVLHRHAPVHAYHHGDAVALTRHGLVHGVVHHLEHQMMQAALGGVADVHPRPPPNTLKAPQDLDMLHAVRASAHQLLPEVSNACLRLYKAYKYAITLPSGSKHSRKRTGEGIIRFYGRRVLSKPHGHDQVQVVLVVVAAYGGGAHVVVQIQPEPGALGQHSQVVG